MGVAVAGEAQAAKAALRAEMRQRLASFASRDGDAARAAARRVADRVMTLPEIVQARGVLTCLSFGPELDTWALAERLSASGRRVYVPRADPADRTLHVHPWPCDLQTLSFGLRQPSRGTPELTEPEIDAQVDAVLVLGLAFDRRGFRLGYGAGYFDRFLAGRDVAAIGLGYELQIVPAVPVEGHDVAMGRVVTERGG